MNFSLYLSLTGWLLAWFSYFINPSEQQTIIFSDEYDQEAYLFNCSDFTCNGTVAVDLTGAPEDTIIFLKGSDLLKNYDDFSDCADPIFIKVEWARNVPFGQDSFQLNCGAYDGLYRYVVGDRSDYSYGNGNGCWGFLKTEKFEYPTCHGPEEDSLYLVSFYNNLGGENWDQSWDLDQPMSTWYGVELNEAGTVSCIDLDGIWDCKYSPEGNGNNLRGDNIRVNLPALKTFSLANNYLTGAKLNGTLPELEELFLSNNLISDLTYSYFSLIPKLRELRIDGNRLSFDDILLSIDTLTAITSANGGSFIYSPQQLVYEAERSIDQPDVDITIDLFIDDTVSTNVYTWYKNDELYQVVNGVNKIQLEDVWSPTAGYYRCEITNDRVPELVLMAHYYLTVDYIENCPQLICSGTYTVDMSQLPDQSSLTFRLPDMIFTEDGPYTGPCASSPLEFYLSIGGEKFYSSDGGDSIVLDCDFFTGSFKYAAVYRIFQIYLSWKSS